MTDSEIESVSFMEIPRKSEMKKQYDDLLHRRKVVR